MTSEDASQAGRCPGRAAGWRGVRGAVPVPLRSLLQGSHLLAPDEPAATGGRRRPRDEPSRHRDGRLTIGRGDDELIT